MSDILQIIKKAAVEANDATNPMQLLFGFVESLEPLEIRINQRMLIDSSFIILGSTIRALIYNNQLKIGDRVLLIREQGGQKFLLSDIIPDEAWLPEYLKGEDGRGIKSIKKEYAVSLSEAIVPTEGWTESRPKTEIGKYIFSRDKITYTNPEEIEYTTPVYDDSWVVVGEIKNELSDSIEQNASNIEKTAEEIRHEVLTNYVKDEELTAAQSTIIKQTSSDIEFVRNTLSENILSVSNGLTDYQNSIEEYIRFSGAKISMGKIGNPFTSELDNESMAFLQDGQAVSYISNKKLYVTDAEFISGFKIGNFRWQPRNNGNLSLVYIGGE